MTLQQSLLEHLTADPNVAPVLGQRIYPMVFPQQVDYPALAYAEVGVTGVDDQQGPTALERSRMQFTVAARTYAEARETLDLVVNSLAGFQGELGGGGGVYVDGILREEGDIGIDDYDDGLDVYLRSADLIVWYQNP